MTLQEELEFVNEMKRLFTLKRYKENEFVRAGLDNIKTYKQLSIKNKNILDNFVWQLKGKYTSFELDEYDRRDEEEYFLESILK